MKTLLCLHSGWGLVCVWLCHGPISSTWFQGNSSGLMLSWPPLFVCHCTISHSSDPLGGCRKWEMDEGSFSFFFTLQLPSLEKAAGGNEGKDLLDWAIPPVCNNGQIFALEELLIHCNTFLGIWSSFLHSSNPLTPTMTTHTCSTQQCFFLSPVLSSAMWKFLDICKSFHPSAEALQRPKTIASLSCFYLWLLRLASTSGLDSKPSMVN